LQERKKKRKWRLALLHALCRWNDDKFRGQPYKVHTAATTQKRRTQHEGHRSFLNATEMEKQVVVRREKKRWIA